MSASLPRPLLGAMLGSSLLYIIFTLHLPVTLYADGRFDDALFSAHAASILAGHWLGPYGQLTFVKGPGFPLFLVFNALLGLPVTLGLAMLLSGACCLFAASIYRLTGSFWCALILLLAIQWHPALIPFRITRDDVCAPQIFIILACLCRFALLPGALKSRLPWAIAGGTVLAWFWMTREDAIWVLPGFLLILAGGIFLYRSTALVATLAFFATMVLVWSSVALVNQVEYGTFRTSDYTSPAFTRVVQDLQSVRAGAAVPYVPVPAKVRAAIDPAVPAFAALEPYLRGPGEGWTQPGCAIYTSTCGDFAGGWFNFALRDAVAAEGAYQSPARAAAYYQILAVQLEAACATGKLTCKHSLLGFLPAITPAQWRTLPQKLSLLWRLITWQLGPPPAYASTGTPAQMQAMETILDRPLRYPTTAELSAISLTGWYYSAAHDWVEVFCTGPGGGSAIPIDRYPSAGVATYVKDPAAGDVRFMFSLATSPGCTLRATGPSPLHLALAALKPGPVVFAGGELFLDSVERPPAPSLNLEQRALLGLSAVYANLLAFAGVLGILCYVLRLALALRRLAIDPLFILTTGIWTLILVRSVLLVLIDISAFPALIPIYMLPGYPLFCMAIILSVASLFLEQKFFAALFFKKATSYSRQ